MPSVLQLRRGTTAQNNAFTGAIGELSYDTQVDTIRVHDGSTAGGFAMTSDASTATLTNKTLTSPIINTGTFGTSILPVSADGTTLGSATKEFSDLFLADGGTIQLGNDQDVTITHVADTGILLNGSSKIQFTNAAESIHSDGSKLILTSNSVAFSLPTADGSAGQFLKTNGSGVLSFDTVSSAADDITAGDAAILITTSSGNITIDAAANDSDIILKGTDGSVDTTFLTIDGSAAGKATFNAGIVIADAGTIGSASDTDAIAIASDGVVTMNQIPVFSAGINVSGGTIAGTLATAAQTNITTVGTLTTLTVDNIIINGTNIGHTSDTDAISIGSDGDVTLTQDLELQHDGATISFGANDDVVLTHVADTGLTLSVPATADNSFPTFNLSAGDNDIAINDVLGEISFQAPAEGAGQDAILVAAGIAAVSEGDFSTSNNATKLVFKTAASATAAETASLSSIGDFTVAGDIVIKDGGLIGSASDLDAIAIASNGVVTFSQAITGQASSALYADLAEMYDSDETIPEGTVVMFAGEGKLKACDVAACSKVAGIVSTDPAYLMNSAQQGVALALAGRVPCKVIGPVEAGDMMISAGNGMAKAFDADVGSPALGTVIGKAIEDHVGDETTTGVIEVLAMMM